MKELLRNKLKIIIARYQKLGLDTPLYQDLLLRVKDEHWLDETALLMQKVQNSEKIFDVSKEINAQKNDTRLDEAFTELKVVENLATTRFYGSFDKVTYQPPEKNKRWPDILVENSFGVTPVEVKLLTLQELSPTKFFQKFIDKINDHALPQLNSYYDQHPFDHGFIFVWSMQPIDLQRITYDNLDRWVKSKVAVQRFDITFMCNFYNTGMWDFNLRRSS